MQLARQIMPLTLIWIKRSGAGSSCRATHPRSTVKIQTASPDLPAAGIGADPGRRRIL